MFHTAERYIPRDGNLPLGDLELGVAGVVYALSAVGCLTAASCRGHGADSWAANPVVFLAANRFRAGVLQALLGEARCGFGTDAARDGLLTVEAGCVTDMMRLAHAILDHRKDLVEHRAAKTRRPQPSPDEQTLFDL